MNCSFDGGMTYNVDRAVTLGFTEKQMINLSLIYGFSNVIGRFSLGLLADLCQAKIYSLTTCLMAAFNALCMTSVVFHEFWSQAVWFGVFMFSYAGIVSIVTMLVR